MKIYSFIFILFFSFLAQANSEKEINVVVTIKPIHSIAANIMQGVAEPDLLLKNNESPHHFNIKPSQARMLSEADLIIYISKYFETGLTNIIKNYDDSSKLNISELKITKYDIRSEEDDHDEDEHHGHDDHDEHHDEDHHGHDDHDEDKHHGHDDHDEDKHHGHDDHDEDEHHGHDDHDEDEHHDEDNHEHDDHDEDDHHDHGLHHADGVDYHLWLDINNAKIIAKAIYQKLITIDRKNKSIYQKNLYEFNKKLTQLDNEIRAQMSPLADKKILIFSDTLQYMERRYNLEKPIIISYYHSAKPSIKRLLQVRKEMKNNPEISCFLYNYDENVKGIKNVVSDRELNAIRVNILGDSIGDSKEQYFNTVRDVANAVKQCLR